MEDPTTLQVSKLIMEHLVLYALVGGQMTTTMLAGMHVLRLSATYGICNNTCMAVQQLSLCSMLRGDFKTSFRHAKLAIQLADQFNEAPGSMHARVKGCAYSSIFAIMRPFHENLEPCIEAYRIGLRTGDLEFSSLSAMFYSLCYLCIGLPLAPLKPDLISFGHEAVLFGRPLSIVALFSIFRQTILNLQELSNHPTILKGAAIDQDEILEQMEGNGRSMTRRDICTFRLMLACIYGDMNVAREMVGILSAYPSSDLVVYRGFIRITYTGLAALRLGRQHGDKKITAFGKRIVDSVKTDVKNGAVNAYPILLMLQAEESPSKSRFDAAIKACGRSGLIQHEAYMYERAGLYSLEHKDTRSGEFYLDRALVLYREWGAHGKVQQLRMLHTFLAQERSNEDISFRSLKGRSRHETKLYDQMRSFDMSSNRCLRGSTRGMSSREMILEDLETE
jgi:hypothetical protein